MFVATLSVLFLLVRRLCGGRERQCVRERRYRKSLPPPGRGAVFYFLLGPHRPGSLPVFFSQIPGGVTGSSGFCNPAGVGGVPKSIARRTIQNRGLKGSINLWAILGDAELDGLFCSIWYSINVFEN